MTRLVADRFVPAGRGWIDIATGRVVRLHVSAAGTSLQQFVWADRCASLSLMRHPLLNVLVDYGAFDSQRVFEAYAVSDALRAPAPAARTLQQHVVRFLQSRGLPLAPPIARLVMREVAETATKRQRSRPIGITLQPRKVLDHLDEALVDAIPGGVNVIDVSGPHQSGIETLHLLTARAARLRGYVPVAAGMLAAIPSLIESLRDRHVALLSAVSDRGAEPAVLAGCLARLGEWSARRHVLIRFRREAEPAGRALAIDPLGATAMNAMVFLEPAAGPTPGELFDAIRHADGRPGRLVERLRACDLALPALRASIVHETRPAYVVSEVPRPAARPRRIGAVLQRAGSRAETLAASGRHGEACRLLERAIRMLDARGEHEQAAACATCLGWILRNRGRSADAARAFGRARQRASDSAAGLAASIGLGVVWTDESRLLEAEAALRSAHAAAEVLQARDVATAAAVALARCLLWQDRRAEAAAVLAPVLAPDAPVEAFALASRIRLAAGDLRRALTAACDAMARAERAASPRDVAVAARALAEARAASGDLQAAREAVSRGLQAASAAHQPLTAIRLRIALLRMVRTSPNTTAEALRLAQQLQVARGRDLPALLKRALDAACQPGAPLTNGTASQSWTALSAFLEIAQAAPEDGEAIAGVCDAVCRQLRASTVAIVSAGPDIRLLAQAGRPWRGEHALALRAMATGQPAESGGEPHESAVVIKYGADRIAALVCRWTAGAPVDRAMAISVAEAAALAAAASVRGLIDRTLSVPVDGAWTDVIGGSPAVLTLREAIVRAARAPFPVLVEGESGSGKELVARAIHRLGSRRDRRLCTVNCAAIADDLLEAELFGHARGAFTGASMERAGIFEEADGATLFLDEIGELSARAQAKLLRVLQDGEVRRIGENLPRRVDTRIVAATNRRLDQEVEAGRFRADLRFRLDVIRIGVPPLRDRATDIPMLASHFWQDAATRLKSHATLAPETLAALSRYDWPGNVRELQNALASLAVHAPRRGRVLPSMLPPHLARAGVPSGASFEAAREEFERRFVRAALARANGHRALTARSLGVTRQGLAKMMRRLGIEESPAAGVRPGI